MEIAQFELDTARQNISADIAVQLVSDASLGDGFRLDRTENAWLLTGGDTGILYGVYHLLAALYANETADCGRVLSPRYHLRMINCWDNAEGTVERGYSGRSLFFEGGRFDYEPARIRQLGRMLASVGLNVLCINNVNVHDPAHKLIEEEWLPQLKELADLLRPFGIRLLLSIDYAHPMRHGIPTSDPLDEQVQAWWMPQKEKVYQ